MGNKMSDALDFNCFLDTTPPYTEVSCSGMFDDKDIAAKEVRKTTAALKRTKYEDTETKIATNFRPKLFCGNEHCKSHQFFYMLKSSDTYINHKVVCTKKLAYGCSNCQKTVKTFYLRITPPQLTKDNYVDNETPISIEKIGEYPRFGKPIPSQALKLIGSERDLFFKGNTCENMGMGIGAFSYYRRVIDAKKDKIFDSIIKVLNLNAGNEELIQELTDAKQETQFTKAVDKIKKALPDSLSINGQNPLTLLYRALSEGLHVDTDEECLAYAHAVKVVLFEFSDRLDSALKEDRMITDAVKLLTRKTAKA